MRGPPSLAREPLLSHGSLTLGPHMRCAVAVFTPGGYPADGSSDPASRSPLPGSTSGLPRHFGRCCSLLWLHCGCQAGAGALVQQWSCAAAGDDG